MKKDLIPEVEVEESQRINISIWFIPIIALLISLWLAYQYFLELGPKITIYFESSGGLKAKQSQIKYLDVPIGTVEKITFHKSGKGVVVVARINKDAKQFINENSKFWIVKPKIDKSGITGLETLVSGSYIQLHSKLGVKFKDTFKGLEKPFLDEKNIKGKRYKLSAPGSYDLEQGSLVYCRSIKVGEIESVKLSANGDFVEFFIFVREPYVKLINSQTQFWNVSNFKLDITKSRLDVNFASSSHFLYGGIEFSTPSKQVTSKEVNKDFVFPLFSSLGEARQKRIGYSSNNLQTYIMHFDQTLGKLDIGAPIRFCDFQIGHVVNIESKYNIKQNTIQSTVITMLDTTAFSDGNETSSMTNLNKAVKAGLKAQLAQSNPILDSLYIELVFDKNATDTKILPTKPYPTYPTKNKTFDNMSNNIKNILVKIEKLPLEKLLNSIADLVDGTKKPAADILRRLDKTVNSINQIIMQPEFKEMPKQLEVTLKELQTTLKSVQTMTANYSGGSKLSDEISSSMKEINKASKVLQKVLLKLDKKPNALIIGE